MVMKESSKGITVIKKIPEVVTADVSNEKKRETACKEQMC